ncbi:SPOR domain-containing protein [Pseudorhodobacter sp. W20_MBD10_FR17]|uniref:SPOR domain-containing protein n=1 Tax=Pseudorhodobacter sp. W20_MBD10_FR17 TaxID=3240266 RepID=UPI003F966DE8
MLFKVLAVASWAALSVVSSAQAQSLAGPAENPPASFKGSQYVDSRGCVFLRAGIGGRVNWVPRISRDRKALCGQSPAAAAREVAAVQAPIPAPAPVVARVAAQPLTPKRTSGNVGKPMETIASKQYSVKPVVPVTPAAAPKVQQRAASAVQRHSRCPAASPYGAPVTLADGRRTLLCSSNPSFDVRAAASRVQAGRDAPQPQEQPSYQPSTKQAAVGSGSGYTPKKSYLPEENYSGNGYKCPASAPVARRFAAVGGGSIVRCTALNAAGYTSSAVSMTDAEMTVPDGYRKAWQDDRLNPNRGIGTAAGQAQQDQIWTRDVPAEAVTTTIRRKVYATSSSNAARPDQNDKTKRATGSYFVQVGTFGDATNAAQTVSRLQGLGWPVAQSRITSKGRQLQIVMAGPFGDTGAAKAALSTARRSGFGDAFIR